MAVADTSAVEVRSPLCGSKRKRIDAPCTRPAGWGTDHPGYGACKMHGGSTRNGRKHALSLMSTAMMRADVVEVDITPMEGLLYPIRRAAATAAHHRQQMATCDPLADPVPWEFWAREEERALGNLARWSKMALDAGVAERLVRMAERAGTRIAASFEFAIEPLDLPAGQRAQLVERFAQRLALLEQTSDEDLDGEAVET